MMTREDDVMIADGTGEDITGEGGIVKTDDLLCATEVGFRLIADEMSLCDETAGEIACHLEQCDRTFLHISTDAYTDARLEMSVKFILLYHIEGYGAMSKNHLARLGIDAGRIGLEARHARQRTTYYHGEHGWHVALATSHESLGIQFRQCPATRVLHGREQVEATEGKTLQLMAGDEGFEGIVDGNGTRRVDTTTTSFLSIREGG